MTLAPPLSATDEVLEWGNDRLTLHLVHGPTTAPRLVALTAKGEPEPDVAALLRSSVPVVELAIAGEGRHGTSGKRHVDGATSKGLRLVDRVETVSDGVRSLRLDLADGTGVRVSVYFELGDGSPVVRTWSEVSADRAIVLEYVSSFAIGSLGHGAEWEQELALWRAANPWSGEFRWSRGALADLGLYDVGMVEYDQVGSKNRIAVTSTGAWSTSELLPMGVLEDLRTGRMLAWQVEHNGAWHYELGDRYGDVYLTVAGPTGAEHQWAAHLDAGESFRTVPVAVGVVGGGWDELGGALTAHRRRVRRPHPDNVELPIIYNDFLNCLMSDPTTERELPLIEAARDLGAEVFCIDAGWYDDEDGGWWDSVGEWVPSVQRFPDGGLAGLVKRIREAGMRVGLWMEPEVVGVRSPLAAELPDEAFFTRGGRRVLEWGRYQLDLRHPAARAHLDKTVDRLMADFSLDYLKLDYNIDIGAGTDGGVGEPVGAGLLGHNRAFVDWVDGILERHPGLTVEGCAAGGSRMDGASGALFPILSLTDQQDFRKMPPIAGAASTAVAPEQSGVWASVAGWMTDEDLAYSVTTSALGRVHLAGRIDTLDERQRDIVRRGLAAYRALRGDITTSTPVWPLGLPGWRDGLISYGLRAGDVLYLAVWRRGGDGDVRIPLPAWLGSDPQAVVLYPEWAATDDVGVVGDDATLALTLPDVLCARLLRLSAGNPNGGST